MKTVMVQPRLAGTKGQLHTKAEQFSSDFGFTFKACIACKKKESLTPLPTKVIRDSYRIVHPKAKVSASNLISFRGSHHPVPPGYVAISMTLKTIDKMLYIYDSTELVAPHPLSGERVNYVPSHYEAQLQKTIPYLSSEDVKAKVKSNLEKIGAIYDITD